MNCKGANNHWWVQREGTDLHLPVDLHEDPLVQDAKAVLVEGTTFIDIGAHVGLYTVNLAPKAGLVVAIEAANDTYDDLISNVRLNNLDNVEAWLAAAWDSVSTYCLNSEAVLEAGRTRDRIESDGSTRVLEGGTGLALPVDDMLRSNIPPVSLVKIDVEGVEDRVLVGMRDTLLGHRPVILLEMHHEFLSEEQGGGEPLKNRVLGLLDQYNYRHSIPIPAGAGYHLWCTPKE